MSSRVLLNLVLCLVVAVLAVWLSITAPGPATDMVYRPISTLDPEAITRITLSRPGKPDLVLQRSADKWRIDSPINAPANPFRVNSLLSLLQAHSISTVSTLPVQSGLSDTDQPVTLSFDAHRFRFGPINPLDRSRYVEYAGNVHLIEDVLYPQLLQDNAFFADSGTEN